MPPPRDDDAHQDDGHDERSSGRQRRRPPLRSVVLLAVGAIFGALSTLTWNVGPSGRVVAGSVADIDPTGSAILLAEPEDLADIGLGIVGVLWSQGDSGEWQRSLSADGFPTCLSPEDRGSRVEIGLVRDPGGLGRPASEVVAWLRCVDG